jgi:hypothetical protein
MHFVREKRDKAPSSAFMRRSVPLTPLFIEVAQGLRLRPLLHEDAQLFKLIYLSILGCFSLAAGKDHSMAPPESIFGARERGRSWRGADRDHSLSCSG